MVVAARKTPAVKARVARAGMRVMRRSGGDMGRGSDQRSVFSIQWSAEYTRSVIERGVTGAWQREDGEVTARSRHSLVGLIVENIKCSFSTTNTSSYSEVFSDL